MSISTAITAEAGIQAISSFWIKQIVSNSFHYTFLYEKGISKESRAKHKSWLNFMLHFWKFPDALLAEIF
jgi:hypothetical protein